MARAARVAGVLGDHTHTLTAVGHDASEDGTGRGTPVIGFAWQAGGNNDASGTIRENETPTLPRSQTLAVAYTPPTATPTGMHLQRKWRTSGCHTPVTTSTTRS